MNRNSTIVAIVAILIVLLLVFFFIFGSDSRHSWYERYAIDGEEPYDALVISSLLKARDKGDFKVLDKTIRTSLPKDARNSAYIFIGTNIYLDSSDVVRLLDFAESGNEVFISSNALPYYITDTLQIKREFLCYDEYILDYFVDTVVHPGVYFGKHEKEQEYQLHYQVKSGKIEYEWNYFQDSCLVGEAHHLGYIDDDRTNFVKLPYGQGNIYLHSTPLAFSNYHLLNEKHLDYAEEVFAFLPDGDIYWDEVSKIPSYNVPGGKVNFSESPFSFILSEPALRTTWYLFLALVFIYVIFRARRRQRIIPLLEPNTNTSMEFVETVGRLYFINRDHKKLAAQKMRFFMETVRNRYHIPAQTIDEALINKLALKAEVPRGMINNIFDCYRAIENLNEVSDALLIKFHESIENFNRKCK